MQDPARSIRHPCTGTVLFLTFRNGLLFHLFLTQLTPFSSCYTTGAGRERSPDQSFARGSGYLCTGAGPSLCKQWSNPTQGAAAAAGAAGRPLSLCGCQCWCSPRFSMSTLRLSLKAGPADAQCRLPCGRAVPAAALTAILPQVCHLVLLCLQDRSCEMIMLTTWWLACVASCNGWNVV